MAKAVAQDQAGDLDGARTTLNQALAINAKSVDCLFDLGTIDETQGHWSEALVNYKKALLLSPDDNSIGQAVDSVEAKVSAQKTPIDGAGGTPSPPLTVSGRDQRSVNTAAGAGPLERDGAPQAGTQANGSSTANGTRVRQLLDQAEAQEKAGDQEAAKTTLQKVLDEDPKNAEAYFELGTIAQTQSDFAAALADYQAAEALNPRDKKARAAVKSMQNKMTSFGAPPTGSRFSGVARTMLPTAFRLARYAVYFIPW